MKTKVTSIVLFLIVLILNLSHAQVTQEWVARYNNENNKYDISKIVRTDKLGNVYVVGESILNGNEPDFLLIKYDHLGNQIWTRRYDGPANSYDSPEAMEIDKIGNIYVTGGSKGIGTNIDYCTIKYKPNGDSVWVKRYDGGLFADFSLALKIDSLNNVFITGQSWLYQYDICTIKYDSNGVEKWINRYNSVYNDVASLLILDHNNIYVAGYTDSIQNQDNYCLIKYNSNGDQQWVKTFNGAYNSQDIITSMAADKLGNIIVTGYSNSTWYENYYTIKYNPAGGLIWSRLYDRNNQFDRPVAIVSDGVGNITITGSSDSVGSYNISTIRYSSNGDLIWNKIFRFDNLNSGASSMINDIYGNLYITGTIWSDPDNYDFVTIKYDSNGNEEWSKFFNGSGNNKDYSNSITLNDSNFVLVTGVSKNSFANNSEDFLTIKYSQLQPNPTLLLNLTVIEEGLLKLSILPFLTRSDKVAIYLRETTSPYSIKDSSTGKIDSLTFSNLFGFYNSGSGNYYLVVKHFNSLETWSKSGGEFLNGIEFINQYNFTTSFSQAYGDNLKRRGSKYCIFTGDIDQSGFIDVTDLLSVFNKSQAITTGNYISEDLNADLVVDSSDLILCYNNAKNLIGVISP